MTSNKKVLSKKRAASPAKGTRASKRLKLLARKAGPPLSTITSQHGSALLSLPREIRDHIYAEALQDCPLTFRLDRLMIVAIQNPDADVMPWQRVQRGLPFWMQSSQQMLYEVLDLIARTFTFQPYGRTMFLERQLAGVPNSLVFTSGGVRNFKIYPQARYYRNSADNVLTDEPSFSFLKLMDSLSLEGASLELVWEDNGVELDKTDLFTQEWREHWNGKFRKVKIEVRVDSDRKQQDGPMWIMHEAEKCALRLVGSGGSASWENVGGCYTWYYDRYEHPTFQELYWVRHVVAERKV